MNRLSSSATDLRSRPAKVSPAADQSVVRPSAARVAPRLRRFFSVAWALITWPLDAARNFFGAVDLDGKALVAYISDVPTCAHCGEEHGEQEPCPLWGVGA